MDIFKTDFGGTYILDTDENGLRISGGNTRVTYTSTENALKITGKVRNQGTMNRAFRFSVGQGQRAVLTIDTGEGLSEVGGVILR